MHDKNVTDNRPYWFDFEAVFGDLWDDINEITRSFGDTINWLRGESATDTEMALTYAGVSLVLENEQEILTYCCNSTITAHIYIYIYIYIVNTFKVIYIHIYL